jgi:hypothetical protein|tara:strand:+ start:2923 stop:3690 length:768 start_codon:yes stop_codon:yes gene_type:complete
MSKTNGILISYDESFSRKNYENQIKYLNQKQKFIDYKNKVYKSLDKVSNKYQYFLCDNRYSNKLSLLGTYKKINSKNFISPNTYTLNQIKNNLFSLIEYKGLCRFPTGYGFIINNSDLLAIDIDCKEQLDALKEICPNIVEESKFKRVTIERKDRVHLYFKRPPDYTTPRKIRRLNIKNGSRDIWICGLEVQTYPLVCETSHIFRDPSDKFNYDIVGHIDDINYLPQVIMDKILENEIISSEDLQTNKQHYYEDL